MSINNPDNFGFEPIKASRPGPNERRKGSSKNKPDSAGIKSDKAIDFSKKVIETLKNKAKEHNSKNKKKVTLGQLKKVYRRGAGAFSSSHRPGKTRGQWAMARVNMFLKMVSGKPVKDAYRKADSDIAKAFSNNYIIEASLEPDDEDFIQADEDIKNYNLGDFDFISADELYLDDEGDGIIFAFEV